MARRETSDDPDRETRAWSSPQDGNGWLLAACTAETTLDDQTGHDSEVTVSPCDPCLLGGYI